MIITRLHRLDVTRLASDYSEAVRTALTDGQMLNVRNGDAVAADYIDTGVWSQCAAFLHSTGERSPAPSLLAPCTTSYVPAEIGGCWDEILLPQFDARHRPCNFVEIMPRLEEHIRRK